MGKNKFGEGAEIVWQDRKRFMGLPLSFTRYSLVRNGVAWFKLFSNVGLFYSVIDEINLYRVYDITLSQSLADKIFGTGTITLYTSDKRAPSLSLTRIKHPYQVRDMLSQYIEEQRKLHKVAVAEFQR
ncbi:MAG: PH domain-containing protein [Clostridia bacterium]|nr:PH domain-containing protein [Clostridia bacterium]